MCHNAFLALGLHRGEEYDVPDGVAAGEEHDAAVYAYAQAARGGHAVLEGVYEVVIHHAGLVVALGAELDLLFKALALVDGVVELGEGVAHLAAADEELEALREARVLGTALGERRDVDGVHSDEGGLDHEVLDLLVVALVESVAPGGLLAVHVDAYGLGRRDGLRVVVDGHEVHAEVLLYRLGHGHPRPAGGQGDVLALPIQLIGAEYLLRRAGEQVLKEVHHVVEVGVGLIELDGGELRVVAGVHALVAEDAAYLVDALYAADDEALEVQLRGDAHVHVDVQRVVVGDEGPGRGAAGDGVEHRGLDLHEPARVQEAADVADELAADLKVAAALVAHDEVDVALAVLELDVGHAVELLGQGAQALGEQRHALDMDADLAGLGLEHIAGDADDVADVVFAEVRELLLADGVGADVELNLALVVLDVAEDGLAHAALGHDAARGLDGLALKGLVVVAYLVGPRAADKAGQLEGVAPLLLECRELLTADLKYFRELLLRGLVSRLLAHLSPYPFSSVLNGKYGELHLARGRVDGHRLAYLVAQQAAAYRALVGDASGHRVGLLGADDLILQLLVLVHVEQFDAAAERDDALVHVLLFDYLGLLYEGLELGYLGVELALLGLGLVVLAVLGQVAEGAGLLDELGDLFFADGFEIVQLLLYLVVPLLTHFVLAFSRHY